MPTPEPPSSITLKIKVPPGYLASTNNDQFELGSVPVNTTIGALRSQIQQCIPSNPAPERQRILYGGRALVDNEQTLADALNTKRDPEQTEYVVHLLVKVDGAAPSRTSTPSGQQSGRIGSMNAPQVPQPHQLPTTQPPQQGQRLNANMMDPFAQHWQQHHRHQAAPHQHTHQYQHPGQGGQNFHVEGVGPDGQRFQIHQHTMHFPGPAMQMPGATMPGQLPMGLPMVPGPNGPVPLQLPGGLGPPPGFMPGRFPQAPPWPPQMPIRPDGAQRTNGTSALDRARENMAEMRRMLDEIANMNEATDDERRRRVEEVQNRVRSVNEYIDPLNLGTTNAASGNSEGRRSAPPRPLNQQTTAQTGVPPPPTQPQGLPVLPQSQHPATTRQAFLQAPGMPRQQLQLPSNPDDVSVYLLSSPQGPNAILFSPQHGTHVGSHIAHPSQNGEQWYNQRAANFGHPPPPYPQAQPTGAAAAAPEPNDPVERAAAQLVDQQAQLAAQAGNGNGQDPLAMQPILNHFWMLVRILIFSYFLLGANLGWQRPVILLGIGLGFWAVRAGLLADDGRVRRWWDGVVGVQPRQAQAAAPQREGGDAAAPPVQDPRQPQAQAQNDGSARRDNTMPTPEQVAQRILNEDAARQQRDRDERQHWLREQLRPVERAVALFVASLWPGIGEAHVREQRRLREEREEEEQRRDTLRQEARRQREEDQKRAIREANGESEAKNERTEAVVEGRDEDEKAKEGGAGGSGAS